MTFLNFTLYYFTMNCFTMTISRLPLTIYYFTIFYLAFILLLTLPLPLAGLLAYSFLAFLQNQCNGSFFLMVHNMLGQFCQRHAKCTRPYSQRYAACWILHQRRAFTYIEYTRLQPFTIFPYPLCSHDIPYKIYKVSRQINYHLGLSSRLVIIQAHKAV